MTLPSTLVVPPSLPRLLVALLAGNLALVGGFFLMFGPGTLLAVTAAVAGGVSGLCLVAAAVGQRPRVVITAEGFASQKLFGEESHKWQDVEGPFAVIKIGWGKAVGYNLRASYEARIVKKPTTLFSGYDAAISGAFRLSAEELADLLNAHYQQYQRHAAPDAGEGGRPAEPGDPGDRPRGEQVFGLKAVGGGWLALWW